MLEILKTFVFSKLICKYTNKIYTFGFLIRHIQNNRLQLTIPTGNYRNDVKNYILIF